MGQFNPNCLSGRILIIRIVLKRQKLNPRVMALQSKVIKCLLKTLLPILLLLNSLVSAGFISPGNSVSIGTSPILSYLLACGHLPTRPPIFSTHDIYTNEQVSKGLRHLQQRCVCQRQGWRANRRGSWSRGESVLMTTSQKWNLLCILKLESFSQDRHQ